MDGLNADLALHVIQFLNVGESGRLALTSKRFYYLVHQYRKKLRGPEVVTVASWNQEQNKNCTSQQLVQHATEKLQSSPDFILAFQNPRSALSDVILQKMPAHSVVLGVVAGSIQVNLPGNIVEHDSSAAIMCASFPNSVIEPFVVDSVSEMETLQKRLLNTQEETTTEWKAMIVYACGDGGGFTEIFLTEMQRALPNVSFVGGICGQGYVSRTRYTKDELSKLSIRELQHLNQKLAGGTMNFVEKSEMVDHIFAVSSSLDNSGLEIVEDSVFGVALGGDVPIRSMVSRGVRSTTHGDPQPTSPYIVHESILTKPGDENYLFRGHDMNSIHMIRKIRNTEEDKVYNASELMASTSSSADFVGLKRPSRDGFELNMLSPYCYRVGSYLILTDGSMEQEESLEGAEIDFFVLDGDACLQDMELTVSKLKEQTKGEEILGAIMFSCSGRGPKRSMLVREEMADASQFASTFPNVPCLGFYAGGEIGPLALAGKQNVFQTGRATLQGFTAVFALFVVPVMEEPPRYHLDDCTENVNNFFATRTIL